MLLLSKKINIEGTFLNLSVCKQYRRKTMNSWIDNHTSSTRSTKTFSYINTSKTPPAQVYIFLIRTCTQATQSSTITKPTFSHTLSMFCFCFAFTNYIYFSFKVMYKSSKLKDRFQVKWFLPSSYNQYSNVYTSRGLMVS